VKILVTGATGFVGEALCRALLSAGREVVGVTRNARRARAALPDVQWHEADPGYAGPWQQALVGCDAVCNLAGEPVAGSRWNSMVKERLRDSRVETTRVLVEGIGALPEKQRPRVLVSASGVDYYAPSMSFGRGNFDDDEIDESQPCGESFLSRVCRDWEAEALAGQEVGLRVVCMRIGLVLGRGGALKKMSMPYSWFAGGPVGSGRQWVSWVHLDDLVRALQLAIDNPQLHGPVNMVAPTPVRNRDFAKALGRALGRPAMVRTPAFAVKVALGEFADYVLGGRRAIPRALLEAGFSFDHRDLDGALAAVYS